MNYLSTHIPLIDFTDRRRRSTALSALFKSCHAELVETKTISRKLSGSTVTCAVIIKNTVILANVGDSRSVVFAKRKDKWSVAYATRMHTLRDVKEKERVLKCANAEVTAIVDRESGKKVGPERVFKKGMNTPGLMMTRSIGDVEAHEIGVSEEGEVDEKILDEGEYAVI